MNVGQEYLKQSKTYGKLLGLSDGEYPVIDKNANPAEWEAWRNYFRFRGMAASAREMGDAGRITWTVPAMWPHEFDASYMA